MDGAWPPERSPRIHERYRRQRHRAGWCRPVRPGQARPGSARLGNIRLRNRVIKAATFEGMSPGGLVTRTLIDNPEPLVAR
jgi:hypothetical protein